MLAKRAQHFFGECRRVLEGVDLWSAGDLTAFGSLMNQSSWSSLHNYEVHLPAAVSAGLSTLITMHVLCRS